MSKYNLDPALTKDEKRRLRKQLRTQARASGTYVPVHRDSAANGTATAEPAAPRVRGPKVRVRDRIGANDDLTSGPEEKNRGKKLNISEIKRKQAAALDHLIPALQAAGLTEDPGMEIGYGYAILGETTPEKLLEKFAARWDGRVPSQFKHLLPGNIIILGPIPETRWNTVRKGA